jgi:hypothetical protein
MSTPFCELQSAQNLAYGIREFDPSLAARMDSPRVESIWLSNVAGELLAIWPWGNSREGTLAGPGKPLMHVANGGARGHLQGPDRSPIGQPVA